jgi:hypothetical protein
VLDKSRLETPGFEPICQGRSGKSYP